MATLRDRINNFMHGTEYVGPDGELDREAILDRFEKFVGLYGRREEALVASPTPAKKGGVRKRKGVR